MRILLVVAMLAMSAALPAGAQPVRPVAVTITALEKDEVIVAKVREWRFRPYVKDGAAVPVCTAVMFRYVLKAPS